jgi:hypothetical protein
MIAEAFLVKYAGGRLGEPNCPEVAREEANDVDIERLETALVDLIKSHPLEDCAATAVFVLKKWEDRSVIPTLIEFMKINFENLTRDNHSERAVWNAMNALDQLGEEIFPWENGFKYGASANEFDRNYRLAAAYLNRKGCSCQ